MKKNDISIIVPCYNSGLYLPEAIESVRKYCGKYTYNIVLVDDGSNDEQTLQVLENYRNDDDIVFVKHENRGLAAARNTGCEAADAEFLLFLDSDNRILTEYIDNGIEFLSQNPDYAVVYGCPKFFGDNSREGYKTGYFDLENLLIGNYIDTCAVVRKTAWESVGGFDTSIPSFEDWNFWLSLAEKKLEFSFHK
jgi:glycosyltransferase involved in cell wall biosynthesis